MTPEDRELVAGLCAERAGLRLDPDKTYLIESRLGPVARREGFATVEEFVEALRRRGEERLVWAAVEALALGETAFFRDPAVFDRIASDILPALARARAGEPVRIWSAACGTGQEVYSLAMALAEDPALAARAELFASDLSERNLEKAQAGLYSQFEVQRGLPARRLVRHFEKRGDLFALSPRIRQMVRWRRVNLVDDLTRLGQFDLILCRNLLASLTGEAQDRVLDSLAAGLAPHGRLVLGLAETAIGERRLDLLDPLAAVFGPRDEGVRSAA